MKKTGKYSSKTKCENYKKFLPLKKYHTVYEIRQNWSFDTVKIIIG